MRIIDPSARLLEVLDRAEDWGYYRGAHGDTVISNEWAVELLAALLEEMEVAA